MRILRQLGLILAFAYAGEWLSRYLPLTLPASVLGLILMLAALGCRLLKPEHLGETADFLSANMAFFFLPAAVTIVENFAVLKPVLVQFTLICLAGTIFTFAASYAAVRLVRRIMEKR